MLKVTHTTTAQKTTFISHRVAPWAYIQTTLKSEGAGGRSFMENWVGDFYFALTGREVSGCDGLHNVMCSKRGFEKQCDTLQTTHLQVWWFLKTISNKGNLKVWCGTQIWRVPQTSMRKDREALGGGFGERVRTVKPWAAVSASE
jgi:hypothetical protein